MVSETTPSSVATLSPRRAWPDVAHVEIEDDTPVDGRISTRQMRLLVNPLVESWSGPRWDPRFDCDANVGIFEHVDLSPIVPDFFLLLGVDWPDDLTRKQNRSYFIEGIGKPPELVVEIVSNSIGGEDTTKLDKYAHLQVRYCLIHDPLRMLSDDVLRIYELIGGRYERMNGTWLAGVDLGVVLWTGRFEGKEDTWLRWVDKDGRLIPTAEERDEQQRRVIALVTARLEEERREREAAETRANEERREREAAEQRIRELEEQLRVSQRGSGRESES